jgi:hypothetical protein
MRTVHQRRAARGPRRRAITVVEVSLVAALTAFLVLMISAAWTGLGRATTETQVRCQLAQEARLVAQALRRDLGGYQPEGMDGDKLRYRVVGLSAGDGTELRICYDMDADAAADWAWPDEVVRYCVDGERLVRRRESNSSQFTVAGHVSGWEVNQEADGVRIHLTMAYRNITTTHTMVANVP